MLLAVANAAMTDGPRSALAMVLVLPPAFALRVFPVQRWLDAALCTALLGAQLGAQTGLTESTIWWDGAAHLIIGALLGLAVARSDPRRSRASTVVAVGALAIGWEAAESASDTALGTNFVPGVVDTLSDLALGITGAAVVAAGSMRRRDARRVPVSPRGAEGDPEAR
jgi:hypothetical protein